MLPYCLSTPSKLGTSRSRLGRGLLLQHGVVQAFIPRCSCLRMLARELSTEILRGDVNPYPKLQLHRQGSEHVVCAFPRGGIFWDDGATLITRVGC